VHRVCEKILEPGEGREMEKNYLANAIKHNQATDCRKL